MIRTLDPLLPKQVRYQAALYSVRIATTGMSIRFILDAVTNGGVIAVRPPLFKRFAQPFQAVGTSCCEASANRVGTAPVGASPSGKASVFGTDIPRFESWRPSHYSACSMSISPGVSGFQFCRAILIVVLSRIIWCTCL